MKRLLLPLALTLTAASPTLAHEVLPGICVNSRQPIQVYLNNQLVCENSLNCVIVNLRPQALYLIEARQQTNPDEKPIYSQRIKVPEKGIQTVVVRIEGAEPTPPPASQNSNTVSTLSVPPSPQRQTADTPPPPPNRTKPVITEDHFDELIVALDKATVEQGKFLIEARTAQYNLLVKHVKQILEMYIPGDQSRIAFIKRTYNSIADRENAFQLVNTINAPEGQNQIAEFIAQYNAQHPL